MLILSNNPYRLLGVYANSPTKERLANHNRMKAFLKVGKPVSFPLDLPQSLPSINRTEVLVGEAETRLTLPQDQMHYAQFWFIKTTPLDEVAFNHLVVGEIDKADEIWQKKETFSSLQNRIVCALIRDDYSQAISCTEALYGNMQYVNQFVSEVIGTGGSVDVTNLPFAFLDALCEETNVKKILPHITNSTWKKHIGEKAIKPLIDKLQDAVDVAKKSRGKGHQARLNAGETLIKSTKTVLLQLNSFLSKTDLQYQMIVDKVGLEILQCGIDYYNDSDDDDAAFTSMKLQKYAQSFFVGKMAKDRCLENVHILEDIISKLPPLALMSNHRAILSYLAVFTKQPDFIIWSIQLIKNCVPHLVEIKEKLGKTHSYYIKISTTIIDNALGKVIAEVNEAQNSDFSTLKKTLISAWRTQLYMDKFDLDSEYKEGRYKECREALHGIISQCKGFENLSSYYMYQYGCGWCNNLDTSDVDLRTEEEFYESCNDLASYRSYLQKYLAGKYTKQAKQKIEQLTFQTAKTVGALEKFIGEFPNSKLVTKAQEEIKRIKKEEEIERIRKEAAKNRSKTIKWSLGIIIPLLILLGIYLIWGIGGLGFTCYVFAALFGLVTFGSFSDKDGNGCLIGIICGIIAFGLGWLGNYLSDLSSEDRSPNTEYVTSNTDKSIDYYPENDYLSAPTTEDTVNGADTVDSDYKTYIDNHLETGSKPYKDYYRSHTGSNYLDFNTSGSEDYVVIVRDYNSSEVVNHIYIRGGDRARLYLPNGKYIIYFYEGNGWNPNMENGNVIGGFVSRGVIQKDGPIELYHQHGEYTLYPVSNGNLHLQEASESEAL